MTSSHQTADCMQLVDVTIRLLVASRGLIAIRKNAGLKHFSTVAFLSLTTVYHVFSQMKKNMKQSKNPANLFFSQSPKHRSENYQLSKMDLQNVFRASVCLPVNHVLPHFTILLFTNFTIKQIFPLTSKFQQTDVKKTALKPRRNVISDIYVFGLSVKSSQHREQIKQQSLTSLHYRRGF